jgi:hypothetical protein
MKKFLFVALLTAGTALGFWASQQEAEATCPPGGTWGKCEFRDYYWCFYANGQRLCNLSSGGGGGGPIHTGN